ncbi:uncharacterized protein LOC122537727 [Frieseomelitta varia]|uniref:uncharacterized protein LOC122537727 n=1 Tax=Frieseomelitta varia TaxID=561572 RepID=UPI001CB685ED|nr:uncharacterized protein LOC122537727 [Frieseomelitta varia]
MTFRGQRRRRKIRKWLNVLRTNNRNLHPSLNNHRLHDHFYATRSKSEQRIVTKADSNQSLVVSKQSSDSSVIYLGTFRKIPELINLEDANDDCQAEVARHDEIQSPKFEVYYTE